MLGSRLTVCLKRAKDLIPKGIEGNCDPYAIIEFGSERRETRVKHNTLNPEWNEQFDFEVSNPRTLLKITIMDRDKFTEDEYEGSC